MKTLIVLCSFLTLQTCNQPKNEQKTEKNTPIEYRETVIVSSEKANATHGKSNEIEKTNPNTTQKIDKVKQDTLLNNIQEKITTASYDGFAKRNTKKLGIVKLKYLIDYSVLKTAFSKSFLT